MLAVGIYNVSIVWQGANEAEWCDMIWGLEFEFDLEGVAVIQIRGDKGIYEDFSGVLGERRAKSRDVTEVKEGSAWDIVNMRSKWKGPVQDDAETFKGQSPLLKEGHWLFGWRAVSVLWWRQKPDWKSSKRLLFDRWWWSWLVTMRSMTFDEL